MPRQSWCTMPSTALGRCCPHPHDITCDIVFQQIVNRRYAKILTNMVLVKLNYIYERDDRRIEVAWCDRKHNTVQRGCFHTPDYTRSGQTKGCVVASRDEESNIFVVGGKVTLIERFEIAGGGRRITERSITSERREDTAAGDNAAKNCHQLQ